MKRASFAAIALALAGFGMLERLAGSERFAVTADFAVSLPPQPIMQDTRQVVVVRNTNFTMRLSFAAECGGKLVSEGQQGITIGLQVDQAC